MSELINASHRNVIVTARRLLDDGADPNIQDNRGNTALIWASRRNNIELVRLLLDRGAHPNIQDEAGGTALMYASDIGNIDIVRLLLNAGADPSIRVDDGWTALMLALHQGHTDIVNLLESHKDDNLFDEPSDPDIDLMRDEAARHIQTIMRARFEADKKRKLTKRRYGTWAPPKTEVEKDRRYIDLIRQFDEEDPIKGYERYSIYPERLLPRARENPYTEWLQDRLQLGSGRRRRRNKSRRKYMY